MLLRTLLIAILARGDRLRQRLQRRVLTDDKALGTRGEDLAHRFLQRRGYMIVARNYRPSKGHREVDLIARHGETLVIVEVKTRRREEYHAVERAVDRDKRHNLERAAVSYVLRARIPWQHVRFDIVSVVLEPELRIRHTPDAFHPDRARLHRPAYATEVDDEV